MSDIWIFGYGSLIWRPDFPFLEQRVAIVDGWVRRFWQGSHDHRGVQHAPGRVVTLVPQTDGNCGGMAFLIEQAVATEIFVQLDYREKNGYQRHNVELEFDDGRGVAGIVYRATEQNHAFLGPAPLKEMAAQILECAGPSGTNLDYLLQLAQALRDHDIDDPHVRELEREVISQRSAASPAI